MADPEIDPVVLGRIREICLALPETTEKVTWDHPTFRVRDKIFASPYPTEADDVIIGTMMTMKATPGEQESLLAAGHPFFFPKYVGTKGWIGVTIDDDTDWDALRELIVDSYLVIAPKRLARQAEEHLGLA